MALNGCASERCRGGRDLTFLSSFIFGMNTIAVRNRNPADTMNTNRKTFINEIDKKFTINPPTAEPINVPTPARIPKYATHILLCLGETESYVKLLFDIINAAFAIPDKNCGIKIKKIGLEMNIQSNGVMEISMFPR